MNELNENQEFRCWLGNQIVRNHKGVIIASLYEPFTEADPSLLDEEIRNEWENRNQEAVETDKRIYESCEDCMSLLYEQKKLKEELSKSLEEYLSRDDREEIEEFLESIDNELAPIKFDELFAIKVSDEFQGSSFKEEVLYLDDELKHINDLNQKYNSFKIDFERNPNKLLSKTKHKLYIIWKELIEKYWKCFKIAESFHEVYDFWKSNIENKQPGVFNKSIFVRWEEWEKIYFYSKKYKESFQNYMSTATEAFYHEHPDSEEDDDFDYDSIGYVYFLRNQDIFKIGITKDLDRRLNELKADELVHSISCSNYKEVEKELHDLYKEDRIPQTEYFRLDEYQVEEIIEVMDSYSYE